MILDRFDHASIAAQANPEEVRDELDTWLVSEIETVDSEEADLMRALGVESWRR